LTQELAAVMVPRVVDFSPKDVMAVASACQRLLVRDSSVLEALARQGLRKGQRLRPRYAAAVLEACEAAGFEHKVVDDLREAKEEEEAKQATQATNRESQQQEQENKQRKNKKKGWRDDAASGDVAGKETADSTPGGDVGGAAPAADKRPDGSDVGEFDEEAPLFTEPWLPPSPVASGGGGGLQQSKEGGRRSSASRGASQTMPAGTEGQEESAASPWHQNARWGPQRGQQHGHPLEGLMEGGGREPLPRLARPLEEQKEDPELRRLLKGVARKVLEPAGFVSEAMLPRRGVLKKRRRGY